MSTEIQSLRTQILANAKIMLKSSTSGAASGSASPPIAGRTSPHSLSFLPAPAVPKSTTTTSPPPNDSNDNNNKNREMDVVIFGSGSNYTAALMVGLTPAVEGAVGGTPEGALRKLLLATCELLNNYIPKVGTHQRNIHGGGVFDEDMIAETVVNEGKERSSSVQF